MEKNTQGSEDKRKQMEFYGYPSECLSVYTSTKMRYHRPWYICPLLVNLGLLFSASRVTQTIDVDFVEESTFPFATWMLYAVIAVTSPLSLAISRVLPDPSMALLVGGLMTSLGLLWSGLESMASTAQIVAFCVLSGAGIAVSMQAITVAISPFFIKEKITVSALTLLISTFVMLAAYPLSEMARPIITRPAFLYAAPVVFVISVIPFVLHVCSGLQGDTDEEKCVEIGALEDSESLLLDLNDEPQPLPAQEIPTISKSPFHSPSNDNSFCNVVNRSLASIFVDEGWLASALSMLVWLSWGAAVDTTWLSMGWQTEYFNSTTGLAALQLSIAFLLLAAKLFPEFSKPAATRRRTNLASNYMHLGLLGASGVLLCLFPESTQPYHNHLLFTVSFALQFDDLSDLYLVPVERSTSGRFRCRYVLVKYNFGCDERDENIKQGCRGKTVTLTCLICHLVCLLLMSCLSMILGVQIANLLGFLSSLPPFSVICSTSSYLVMSVSAVCVSLLRPDKWINSHHTHISA